MLQKEITLLPPTPLSDPAASFMLLAASTHIAVWKKKTKNHVCPLSHIHAVVELRSSAGGRTCLFSLCMAQTGASQPGQIHGGW